MTEPAPDPFLDRLWEAWTYWIRTERGGSSQGKLAGAVAELSGQGTRQEDVSRWLKGRGRPSFEELPSLAQAMGVRRDWLAFNDGPMVAGKGSPAKDLPVARDTPATPRKKQDGRKHA